MTDNETLLRAYCGYHQDVQESLRSSHRVEHVSGELNDSPVASQEIGHVEQECGDH